MVNNVLVEVPQHSETVGNRGVIPASIPLDCPGFEVRLAVQLNDQEALDDEIDLRHARLFRLAASLLRRKSAVVSPRATAHCTMTNASAAGRHRKACTSTSARAATGRPGNGGNEAVRCSTTPSCQAPTPALRRSLRMATPPRARRAAMRSMAPRCLRGKLLRRPRVTYVDNSTPFGPPRVTTFARHPAAWVPD